MKDQVNNRPTRGGFAETEWAVVLAAAGSGSEAAAEALEQLCRTYWYPLYAFVRRQGFSPEEASDLTQEFFARFIAKGGLAGVDQRKGKFRTFLIAALRHFLSSERDRTRAQKRGGGRMILSLDAQDPEARYRLEPADSLSADRLCERRWALTLLESALGLLREECARAGKAKLHAALEPGLAGGRPIKSYAEIAARLGMTEGAVKVAAHRLRTRFVELLRAEVARTVGNPAEVDEELRHLIAVLAR